MCVFWLLAEIDEAVALPSGNDLIGEELLGLYITFYRCGTGAALSRKDKQLES